VNTTMNLRVSYNVGKFLIAKQLAAFQEVRRRTKQVSLRVVKSCRHTCSDTRHLILHLTLLVELPILG
jgi:hypothetical protein